jgi:DNA repair protein RecO (recombination protein O)
MPHSFSCEAIVLRTYDVGEADRYCILFTRERGRVAVRARAVRKMTSRMGGCMLPMQHVKVELKESSAGFMLAGATHSSLEPRAFTDVEAFSQAEQGMELLLSLLQPDEPLPDIFRLTLEFLALAGHGSPHLVLGYTLCVLHHLGLLPAEEDIETLITLQPEDSLFLRRALRSLDELPELSNPERLQRLCRRLMDGQLISPLKAENVVF